MHRENNVLQEDTRFQNPSYFCLHSPERTDDPVIRGLSISIKADPRLLSPMKRENNVLQEDTRFQNPPPSCLHSPERTDDQVIRGLRVSIKADSRLLSPIDTPSSIPPSRLPRRHQYTLLGDDDANYGKCTIWRGFFAM
jgi:polygalacturonase